MTSDIDALPHTSSTRTNQRLPVTCASILIAAGLLLVAVVWGTALHRWTWDKTAPIRLTFDVQNAYTQGQRAASLGLLNTYDGVAATARLRPDGVRDYQLDYPPLRLAAATWWYQWAHERFGEGWQNSSEYHQPLLLMNEVYLIICAGAVFGLVHQVRRWRATNETGRQPGTGVGMIPAAIAACLVWLNPCALLIGFGWPQWDICVPAFFLASLCAGSRNKWLLAGALLAVGAMYKGQVLAGLPVLILFPIVAGQWSGLLRATIGFFLAAGVIAAPFAMHGRDAIVRPEVIWFAAATLAPWLLAFARAQMPTVRRAWWIIPAFLAIYACTMAGWVAAWHLGAVIGSVLGTVIYFAGQRLSWRYQACLPALGITVAIWSAALLSGASWNWLNIGFLYGADHYPAMAMGAPSNFASILTQFRVTRPTLVAFNLPDWLPFQGGDEVTWRGLLRSIYIVGSVLCGIAMGVHFRRKNPLFLMGAATAWLMFVTFPAQIHERYILYPALVSATFVALGFGWTCMHLAITAIAVLPVLQGMLSAGQPAAFLAKEMGPDFGVQLLQNVRATNPGIGWALVTISLVCLWKTMDVRRPAVQRPGAVQPQPDHQSAAA